MYAGAGNGVNPDGSSWNVDGSGNVNSGTQSKDSAA